MLQFCRSTRFIGKNAPVPLNILVQGTEMRAWLQIINTGISLPDR